MKSVCALIFALAAIAVHAETWECRDRGNDSGPVLVTAVTATADQPNAGRIAVAGTEISTSYRVDGFDRRWDFGDGFRFVISPNGDAVYYGSGAQFYSCRLSKKQ
jgi:hypothetical protein